jgi:hypothetical protein
MSVLFIGQSKRLFAFVSQQVYSIWWVQVEMKLADLESQLNAARDKKKKVQDEADNCSMKIGRANQLMSGLGGEKTRWTASAESFGIMYVKLTGDILLCAGMIAYLGTFTPTFRENITRVTELRPIRELCIVMSNLQLWIFLNMKIPKINCRQNADKKRPFPSIYVM